MKRIICLVLAVAVLAVPFLIFAGVAFAANCKPGKPSLEDMLQRHRPEISTTLQASPEEVASARAHLAAAIANLTHNPARDFDAVTMVVTKDNQLVVLFLKDGCLAEGDSRLKGGINKLWKYVKAIGLLPTALRLTQQAI